MQINNGDLVEVVIPDVFSGLAGVQEPAQIERQQTGAHWVLAYRPAADARARVRAGQTGTIVGRPFTIISAKPSGFTRGLMRLLIVEGAA